MWVSLISAFFICLTQLLIIVCLAGDDYYRLLGVTKDADERTIRRAFKKLAITKHPDKDPVNLNLFFKRILFYDNPKAHEDFIKINKAYEVLKDPETRRKYDQGGEEGLESNNAGQNYQSWDFYNNKFGIYDDDPEIFTLSRQDFQHYVIDSGDFWFVNFYSTFCSHCHDLAPTWREFARKMSGIIKIGAVNCAEDPHLCQSQNVRAYPSLLAYPDVNSIFICSKKISYFQKAFFQGKRDMEPLIEFITSKLRVELIQVTSKNIESLSNQWEPYAFRPWLIDFCDEMENCFKQADKLAFIEIIKFLFGFRRMIAHLLDKTVNIGTIMCHVENKDKLCDELRSEGLAFYPAGKINKENEHEIDTFDLKEIHQKVLRLLPDIPQLDENAYRNLLDNLEEPRHEQLLIVFASKTSDVNDELKKLGTSLDLKTKFLIADCSALADGCQGMHLGALPRMVLFRNEGNYLIYYGKKDLVFNNHFRNDNRIE